MNILPNNDEFPASPQSHLAHQSLQPNWAFSLFTLISVGFLIFEFFFLILYSNDFWFNCNIYWLGIPTVLIALILGHFLLIFNESTAGCQILYPLKKGAPFFVYRKWVQIDESGIIFGNRHLLWTAIDEVNLNFWGTLVIKSKSLYGPRQSNPDIVLKLPFNTGTTTSQQKFLQALQTERPEAKMNQSLRKRLQAKDIKGTVAIQLLGVIFMLVILLDVGQSTFSYLEMMKDYYLCETNARDGKQDKAETCFRLAEQIREHPFILSWVSNKLLSHGRSAAGVFEAKSNAQWYQGKNNDAIKSAKQALKYDPKSSRLHLHLARYLSATGQYQESIAQIQSAIETHTNNILPRLYMISSLVAHQDKPSAIESYDKSLDDLRNSVFGQEPLWSGQVAIVSLMICSTRMT